MDLADEVGGEEVDRLRDVLGEDAALQQAALPVELLDLVLADAVALRALLLPVPRPDARAADDRVGVHHVDPDAGLGAFEGEAAGEVQLGRLGRAVGRGPGRGHEGVLAPHEDDGSAPALPPHEARRPRATTRK